MGITGLLSFAAIKLHLFLDHSQSLDILKKIKQMMNCFRPVWGLIILLSSKICEFLFHLISYFKHSLFPNGHEESGDLFHTSLLCFWWGWEGKLVNRTELQKMHFLKAPNLPRGVCATGVRAQSKSDFSAIVSKLYLIFQTLLLFHSWLPLPCFIDTVCSCAE